MDKVGYNSNSLGFKGVIHIKNTPDLCWLEANEKVASLKKTGIKAFAVIDPFSSEFINGEETLSAYILTGEKHIKLGKQFKKTRNAAFKYLNRSFSIPFLSFISFFKELYLKRFGKMVKESESIFEQISKDPDITKSINQSTKRIKL